MTKEEYQIALQDIAYLASCAVNEVVPDAERVAGMDLDVLYRMANLHLLTGIIAMALESAGVANDLFTQAKGKAIRKVAALDLDRMNVLMKLESAGIWYMPLKGSVLKELYPKTGMRQMSDNDILFDESRADDVKLIMESLGFTTMHFGTGNHDVYHKEPVSNFEMHRALFGPGHRRELYTYYQDVKERLIKDEASQYGYHFSPEDFYCYMLAHEYKHYSVGGTGLRSLLDTYVYLRKHKDSLDWPYIEGELEKLNLVEFEERNRSLAEHLFDGAELTDEEREMLMYIASSGTYGTLNHRVENGIRRYGGGFFGKLRYLYSRVFLPMEVVERAFPLFYQHKILLPLLPFYRLARSWPKRKDVIKTELRIIGRADVPRGNVERKAIQQRS